MSAQGLFQEGVKSFEARQFDSALGYFDQALAQDPNNVTLLVNKALAHYELGQKYEALAHMMKAQVLDPGFQPAQQGLEFLKQQVQIRAIPHQIEFFEQARNILVEPFDINWVLFLCLVLTALTGAFWVRHFVRKKQAFLSGQDYEPVTQSTWISTALLSFSLFWSTFYLWDLQQDRGIVKTETLSLRSSPDLNSPTILQLNGGLEVRILRRQKDWLQIQFPGSFSGWAEKNTVLEL